MLAIDPSHQTARDNYKLLIGSILPRPIAFITTLSDGGVLNGAPFSYFSIVSSDPPRLSIAVQRKDGAMKDTARNAVRTGELVVHIVDAANVEAVNETAASAAPDVSEVELAGLTPAASDIVQVPGVAEAKVRMECVLERHIELDDTAGEPSADLLIARVVRYHIHEDIYEDGRIDAAGLAPVGRMAGNYYAKLGASFELERPM